MLPFFNNNLARVGALLLLLVLVPLAIFGFWVMTPSVSDSSAVQAALKDGMEREETARRRAARPSENGAELPELKTQWYASTRPQTTPAGQALRAGLDAWCRYCLGYAKPGHRVADCV